MGVLKLTPCLDGRGSSVSDNHVRSLVNMSALTTQVGHMLTPSHIILRGVKISERSCQIEETNNSHPEVKLIPSTNSTPTNIRRNDGKARNLAHVQE